MIIPFYFLATRLSIEHFMGCGHIIHVAKIVYNLLFSRIIKQKIKLL